MKKGVFALVFQRLFHSLSGPLFYLCALVLNFFCAGSFFLGGTFFSGLSGTSLNQFFNAVPYISVVVIPVLCLNPFSSYEKMLPFSRRRLELAKVASKFIEFLAMLVPSLSVPVSVALFGRVEAAEVFTGFLFISLYALASIALCFLMQSVTENSGISFLLSIIVLSFSNSVHLFSRSASSSGAVSVVLRFLSFAWHFDSAGKGIFDSRDFVFFAAVFFLLVHSNVVLHDMKLSRPLEKSQKRRNAMLFAVILLFLLDGQRFYFRKDFTVLKSYSISEYSRRLLDECDGAVSLTYYRTGELERLYPSVKDVNELLNEYARHRNVSLLVEDPSKTGLAEKLEGYGIYPRQIQSSRGGKIQYTDVYSAVMIEMSGAVQVVPFTLSPQNLEFQVTEKIARLFSRSERYVNVLCGGDESVEKDYSYLVQFLSSQGFTVNHISENSDIPLQIRLSREYGNLLLVLGSSRLGDAEVHEIENYMEGGGKVLFAASPYVKDIAGSWRIDRDGNQRLVRLLSSYGVNFSKKIVGDISSARILLQDDSGASRYLNYPLWPSVLPQENAPSGMTLFWPVELILETENAVPILHSSRLSYEVEPLEGASENLFSTNPLLLEEDAFSSGSATKERRPRVLSARYSGESYGYYNPGIFNVEFTVVSDQYFLNSLMLGYIGGESGDYRNLDFLVNELLKLDGDAGLSGLYEKSLAPKNTFFKTPDEKSFESARKKSLVLNFIFPPLFYACVFCVFYFQRRRNLRPGRS